MTVSIRFVFSTKMTDFQNDGKTNGNGEIGGEGGVKKNISFLS